MSTHTITVPDDLSGLDPDTAQALLAQIDDHVEPLWAVRARVEQIAQAPAKAADLAAAFLDARDGTQPDTGHPVDWPPYRQPTGAHDAYPVGRVIRWTDGRLYRAVRSGVAHSPAEYPADWTDVTDDLTGVDPPDTPTAAEWSAAASYAVGDLVSRGGAVYRCLIAHGAEYAGTWGPPATGVWESVV